MLKPSAHILRFVVISTVLLCFALPALATGRLRGSVQDADGNPLADVPIWLVCKDTSIPTTKIKSNKKGKFVFGLIRNGIYTVVVKQEGMRLKRIDANLAIPDDESLWSFHEELVLGADLPEFNVTGVTTLTYDIQLEPHSEDLGQYGTGRPVSPSVRIVKMLEEQKYDEALELVDSSIERAPGAASLHYLRAFALDAMGRTDDALSSADRMLTLDPSFEGGNLLKGKILESMGKTDEAIRAYRDESKTGKSIEVRRDALIAVAAASTAVEKPADAIAALEELIVIVPDHAGAYKELADLYLRRGNDGDEVKAKEMMTRVNDLGAGDPNLLYNMGAERFNANDFEAAAGYFSDAVEVDPSFREAHLRLAYTRLSLGQMDQAAESLQAFLDLSSEENEEVQSARAILQQLEKK